MIAEFAYFERVIHVMPLVYSERTVDEKEHRVERDVHAFAAEMSGDAFPCFGYLVRGIVIVFLDCIFIIIVDAVFGIVQMEELYKLLSRRIMRKPGDTHCHDAHQPRVGRLAFLEIIIGECIVFIREFPLYYLKIRHIFLLVQLCIILHFKKTFQPRWDLIPTDNKKTQN